MDVFKARVPDPERACAVLCVRLEHDNLEHDKYLHAEELEGFSWRVSKQAITPKLYPVPCTALHPRRQGAQDLRI
jgi:hypothetical protein